MTEEKLIQKHGGYKKLKSFQFAELIYDLTVRFCDRYIDKKSRTHDQMVQAARSGKQNIAEGSQCSGTSKKFEIKLTNVARSSLEELELDYKDFLRQRRYPQLNPEDPIMQRFKEKRCSTVEDVREWVRDERKRAMNQQGHGHTDEHGRTRTNTDREDSAATQSITGSVSSAAKNCPCKSVSVRVRPCVRVNTASTPIPSSALAANGILSLLNLCKHFFNRQISTQAQNFEDEGAFTERLHKIRIQKRNSHD